MAPTKVVDMQHVYYAYGQAQVVEDVNFLVEENDFLSIIGPNGGGKSTILKIILGLLTPDQGNVKVFGMHPKKARQRIGYLPQLFNFDFEFPIRVMDIVLMGRLGKRGLGKRYTSEDRDICFNALHKVGMDSFSERQIGDLSGGQRQRVFIARALATEPALLLLDEPVASVDSTWQQTFYHLLEELNKEMTIIMVTHDIAVVSLYIDKIACINKKLYYHGSKKDGMEKLKELHECPVHLIPHEPFDLHSHRHHD